MTTAIIILATLFVAIGLALPKLLAQTPAQSHPELVPVPVKIRERS